TLERSQSGLGIGLTLVQRLVTMHGGLVLAQSDGEGTGSEFVVRLPLHPDQTPRAVAGKDAGACGGVAPKFRNRVLVVDDNQDSANSLAILLKFAGNEVETANDGVEAVSEAQRFRPDMILLDIGMPRLNGYDAARRIREQAWGKDIMLVALTGWGQEEDRRKSRDAGFDEHLVKPVDHDTLMKLLEARAAKQRAPSA
ncbi:MAG TPA: response regulator, partial [Burkholderiales bacterium]